MPLNRRDGSFFGTLCALDPLPAALGEHSFAIFQLLANLIAFELEAGDDERSHAEELEESRRIGKLREQLIGVLGHDLRNPLSAIMMAAQLLIDTGNLPDAPRRLADKIVSNSERINRMIGDMLDLTRTRLGAGIPVMPRPVDMETVCRQSVEDFRVAHSARRIEFAVVGDARGLYDADRVAQVISNLLANALQYSLPESPVRVSLREEEAALVLEVNNQGQPIVPEVLQTIFVPFQRGAQTDAGNLPTSGLGLGLYIVQEIMRAHGGTVAARSTADEGTTFSTRWPCHAPLAKEAAAPA